MITIFNFGNLGNPQKFNYEAVQIIHCKYVTLLMPAAKVHYFETNIIINFLSFVLAQIQLAIFKFAFLLTIYKSWRESTETY